MAQHLSRERVAELMGAFCRRLHAGTVKRMSNDRSNATRAQKAADRGFAAQKHTTTRAARASVPQVGGDCRADLRWKGKRGSLIAFTSDAYLSGVPVNILQLEKGHFA